MKNWNDNSCTSIFYKKNIYKKMSLKNPKTLRKSPASNALAAIFKNIRFS